MVKPGIYFAAAFAGLSLSSLTASAQQQAQSVSSSAGPLRVETLVDKLEFPWGLAFLPDDRLLITEKPGRLRIFNSGKLSAPISVPGVSHTGDRDQGGLLDIAIHPAFANNNTIYFSYSEVEPNRAGSNGPDNRFGKLDPADNMLRGGAVASARLEGESLQDIKVIWRQTPKTAGRGHFGHRLVFGKDRTLFITSGDRMRFDPAQDMSSSLGKVLRINTDGSPAQDNPFAGKGDVAGQIYSLGHRNMLAAAVQPQSGQLWVWEMGPLGGDEMNLVQPGKNYGWPEVSNGSNYDRSDIPDHPTRPEFEAPVKTWTPVISPSGAIFYSGTLLPWQNSALVGGLSSRGLIRLTMDGAAVANEERIDLGKRVRGIAEGRDGALYVITDSKNGELLRITKGEEKK